MAFALNFLSSVIVLDTFDSYKQRLSLFLLNYFIKFYINLFHF